MFSGLRRVLQERASYFTRRASPAHKLRYGAAIFGLTFAGAVVISYAVLSSDPTSPQPRPNIIGSDGHAGTGSLKAGSEVGEYVMNGISLSQFPDFEKKWRFVSSRFRTDTGEMRLTYANEVAWKALEKGSAQYPDGAVFAKIGLMTRGDPAFTSSKAPVGARRFQLMVRDRRAYADHDGWGYGLYDGNGRVFYGSMVGKTVAQVTDACHACHKLVEHRDFVFSIPMDLSPGKHVSTLANLSLTVPFATVAAETLLPEVRQYTNNAREVRLLQGSLQQHFFQGTLAEIQPTLAEEAVRTGLPSVLTVGEGNAAGFIVVKLDASAPDCAAPGNKAGKRVETFFTWPALTQQKVQQGSQCEPVG
jgi:Cytochrome P460